MKKLLLGVSRGIITPEIGCNLYGYTPDTYSESVADDLTATAFYFEQGDVRAIMVSLTVCEIQNQLSDDIRGLIEEKFNIPKENCLLCAIHTHSGPNTTGGDGWGAIDRKYCDEIFVPCILSAVEEAMKNPQPVVMGTAEGTSLVGINRRELNSENQIDFGQNPWGVFNPRMTVISFKTEDGNILANMIHYGCHCTAAGRNHEISRDWAGIMTDTLEEQSGGITAFFNGPEGDVGPRISNGRTTGNSTKTGKGGMDFVRELGAVAAQDAVRIFNKIFDWHEAQLSTSAKDLKLPLQKRVTLEEARERYSRCDENAINIQGLEKVHLEKVIESYESGYEEKDFTTVPQSLVAIGNIVFAGFPYEQFSEIGLRIDKYTPNARVLSLSNTNGCEGYFVTEDAICRGGYEVGMFLFQRLQPYANDADWHLVTETVKHIQEMKENF